MLCARNGHGCFLLLRAQLARLAFGLVAGLAVVLTTASATALAVSLAAVLAVSLVVVDILAGVQLFTRPVRPVVEGVAF